LFPTGTRRFQSVQLVPREDIQYDPLAEEQVRLYLLELERNWGMGSSTRNQHAAGLRLFFSKKLKKRPASKAIVQARTARSLPEVLSGSDVIRLLGGFDYPAQKTVALLEYGTGLRLSASVSLRVKDIDCESGVIHVRHGKGGKPGEVALGESLLGGLRKYWASCRPRVE
jgi:integrase/recombinase XerD